MQSGEGDDFVDLLSMEPLPAADGGGAKMSFPVQGTWPTDADSVSAVFNLALPQYLTSLLRNDEFKMTFDAQIDVSKGESHQSAQWQKACAKIATSSEPLSATNKNTFLLPVQIRPVERKVIMDTNIIIRKRDRGVTAPFHLAV